MATLYLDRLGFRVVNHGSVCMIHAGALARAWLQRHTLPDATWLGDALAVEPRYVAALADAMEDEGFARIDGGA